MAFQCIMISAEQSNFHIDEKQCVYHLNGLQQLESQEISMLTQSLLREDFVGWQTWPLHNLRSQQCTVYKTFKNSSIFDFIHSSSYFAEAMPPLQKLIEFFTTKLGFSVVTSFSTRNSRHPESPDTLVWTLQRPKGNSSSLESADKLSQFSFELN